MLTDADVCCRMYNRYSNMYDSSPMELLLVQQQVSIRSIRSIRQHTSAYVSSPMELLLVQQQARCIQIES